MPTAPIPPALQALAPLAGTWHTTGTMAATSAPYTATDTYEWLPGCHFLLHRWDAAMPEGRSQGIEVIGADGPDGEAGHYTMQSFDDTGKAGTMHAVVNGKDVAFDGDGMRFRGAFNADATEMSGTWSLLQSDGSHAEWQPWMTVALRRAP